MTQQPNDNQEKIQQLATDPEFLSHAAKGSMDKRQAVIDRQPNTNKEKRIMSKIPVFNRVSKFTDTVTLEHPRLESKTATAVALFDQWLRWCEEEGNLTARQITHVTKAFWLTPEEYEKKHAKSQTNGDLVGGVK